MFYGWYVVAGAFVVAVWGWGFGFYGTGVYLASLRAFHGWPTMAVSWAITLYYVCAATWTMFVGDVIDRFGPRRVVLAGAAAMGSGVALLASVQAPWHAFPAFVVMSFGWAAMSVSAINAIVAPWFGNRRGLAISLALNGSSTGGVLVTPLLILLVTTYGFRHGLHAAVAIMAVVMIPVVIVLKRPPDAILCPDPDGRLPRANLGRRPRWSRRALLRDRRFLTIAIPFALGLLAQVGFLTHQLSYLLQFADARSAALVVSATTAAAVVGRTLTGLAIENLDRRIVSAANFGLQAGALAMLLPARSAPLIYAGCVLFGLGVGNVITLPSLIVQREFPDEDFSRIVSLVGSVNQYTFALGPAILGALRDVSGDYRTSLLLCAGLFVAAAIVVLSGRGGRAEARRGHRRRTPMSEHVA